MCILVLYMMNWLVYRNTKKTDYQEIRQIKSKNIDTQEMYDVIVE